MSRVVSQCQQCGSSDDHPKAHWSTGETYHHDCLPFDKRREVIDGTEHGLSIIQAAESGKRGSALLGHIADLHKGA